MTPARLFWIATAAFTAIGALLRLKGIHDPIFDHPGWRQGDTAAIARNFAQLQYNILFPADRLQRAAAQLRRARAADRAVSRGDAVQARRRARGDRAADLARVRDRDDPRGRRVRALAVEVRRRRLHRRVRRSPCCPARGTTATPSCRTPRWCSSRRARCTRARASSSTTTRRHGAAWWLPALLLMTAFLAKPVAVTAAIPIVACALARLGLRTALLRPQLWALFAVAFVPARALRRLRFGARGVALGQRDHEAARDPVACGGAHVAGRVRSEGRRVRVRVQAARDDDARPRRLRARARGVRRAAALAHATRWCGAGSAAACCTPTSSSPSSASTTTSTCCSRWPRCSWAGSATSRSNDGAPRASGA